MDIEEYFSEPNGNLCFSRDQGSRFAKSVAGDFNPLHDVDARNFCVPGDLLFAVLLTKYGVSRHMKFAFTDMLSEGVELVLPAPAPELSIRDLKNREYLQVARAGAVSSDASLVQKLVRRYVEFSGRTFPHILEPLLASKNVMINPARPRLIYQSMSIAMDRLDCGDLELRAGRGHAQVNGRRGAVTLAFEFTEADTVIGRGCKCVLLGGLRPYDSAVMTRAIAEYEERRRAF